MRLRRAVKQQARRELKGRLWQGVLVFFLWGLAWGMVSFLDRAAFHLARSALERFGQGVLWVTIATMGLRTLLLVPLEAGVTTWFAALVQGWTRPLTTVFWAYGNRVWLRSLGVRLHAGLVSWGTALIPLAGEGFSLWLLREKLARLPPRELMLALGLAGGAAVAWLLFAWTYSQRFAMAVFLLGPDYGCSAADAIALSVEYTRGHRWELVRMSLSFLPWLLACPLVLPALYLLPYYTASRVGYFTRLARRACPAGSGEMERPLRPLRADY
ncbi:MAG: DUF975 family protein [Angelakisella sp.]|jgi:hypothetical protein|nr:DUF975 family protein [Angelakisella sp.]